MTEQVEKQHERFMSDIGFSSIQKLYDSLDDMYSELDSVRNALQSDYYYGDEHSDVLDIAISSIGNIRAIVYLVKEGAIYPFLLEPTVLWVLAPTIAQVKEDLDHAIKPADNEELVKQLKKVRKKVKKLIKRIGPGVVSHCIADSTGFLLKSMALHKCGPECENHDREEGDVL